MIYSRTFHIQSAHFNGRKSYETYWKLVDGNDDLKSQDLIEAFADIHGHNYKIVIEVTGTLDEAGEGWLIDDMLLEQLVKQWDNINLSTHIDFTQFKQRATTENMAMILLHKCYTEFLDHKFLVRVYENADIYAQAQSK